MATVDDIIDDWGARKSSLRCGDVVAGLTTLGFVLKEGKSPGHKTFSHPKLRYFRGAAFNCGHGKNPEILSSYVVNLLRILKQLRDDLREPA